MLEPRLLQPVFLAVEQAHQDPSLRKGGYEAKRGRSYGFTTEIKVLRVNVRGMLCTKTKICVVSIGFCGPDLRVSLDIHD